MPQPMRVSFVFGGSAEGGIDELRARIYSRQFYNHQLSAQHTPWKDSETYAAEEVPDESYEVSFCTWVAIDL